MIIDKFKDLKYDHSDILYINKEHELQNKVIELAFESDNKWTSKSCTKDENGNIFCTDYKITDNNSMYTLRSKTIINNANIDDYYDYLRGEYNDNLHNFFYNDCMNHYQSLQSNMKILKCIDPNHQLIYSSFKSSNYESKYIDIYPRDFLYIQSRFKLDSYQSPFDGEEFDIVNGSLCYSINYGHPFYIDPPKDIIRGNIIYGGLILSSLDYNSFNVTYILCMDYCGYIPYFINNNFILPYKANELKMFKHSWHRNVANTKHKRKDNQFKDKKLEPVFRKSIKNIGGNIDEVINNRNNEIIII